MSDPMLEKVISGGQTGVDQAGLRAARALGIPTGGFAPRGWQTEDGSAPWLADWGLVEADEPGYPTRTRLNAAHSDGTIWLGDADSTGGRCTIKGCRIADRPYLIVKTPRQPAPELVIQWIAANNIRILNCAGHRESSSRGIGKRAEWYFRMVFELALR